MSTTQFPPGGTMSAGHGVPGPQTTDAHEVSSGWKVPPNVTQACCVTIAQALLTQHGAVGVQA